MGCKDFGREVMTHPVVVSVSENHFVPLLVHNNGSGQDTAILRKFNEPSWNYQVLRFLDESEKDIIPRKDKVWMTLELLQRMQLTLKKEDRSVPNYLDLAISELDTSKHKTVAISQHCFWVGEAKLGLIEGVVLTEAGWYDGREVTKIVYDSSKVNIKKLITQAKQLRCADGIYIQDQNDLKIAVQGNVMPAKTLTNGYRAAKESDQKRQVKSVKLPQSLSAGQLTKFNAFFHVDQKVAASFLTEDQRSELLTLNR